MFTDESRFNLKFAEGRILVWRRNNKRYHVSTVLQKDRIGDGSLIGGIHYVCKTNLMIFRWTLHASSYCDNILIFVVRPFLVQRNHNLLSKGQCNTTYSSPDDESAPNEQH